MVSSRRDVFLVVYIAIQIALPLRWYLRGGFDERFAWRMFSDIRATRCVADFAIAGEPVVLEREVPRAWITLANRARPSVLDAIGRRLCEEAGVDPVTLTLTCSDEKGGYLPVRMPYRNLCAELRDR